MSEQFVADQTKAKAAQAEYLASMGTPDEAAAEVRFRRDTVSPRRRILQRISVLPDGVRFLVDMREQLLPHLRAHPTLVALDVEMEYMFSTWFDVGFLELRRMSWDSPASLLEKLIKYEAVHDIRSWADLKNRLDSDRRFYGFFHPRLPQEPLIFVEVALLGNLADSITPLLDESAAAAELAKATTAIFYSISNTQAGLRGVSFGDSLIKRVRRWLMSSGAEYLARGIDGVKPVDPVARFHLGNGARIERLNWLGDPSPKGLKQSYGLMVNYLYDLNRLDKHRNMLAQGKIPISGQIKGLAST